MRYLTTTLTFLLMVIVSCGQAEKKKEAQPQSVIEGNASPDREYIEVNISALDTLEQGDVFRLKTKDSGKEFNLQVRQVRETMPGITSISANIESRDTGLATLLLRDGKLTGSMEFYQKGQNYRVGYDTTASSHYMRELLPKEMDELEGSVPLIPGRDNQ